MLSPAGSGREVAPLFLPQPSWPGDSEMGETGNLGLSKQESSIPNEKLGDSALEMGVNLSLKCGNVELREGCQKHIESVSMLIPRGGGVGLCRISVSIFSSLQNKKV